MMHYWDVTKDISEILLIFCVFIMTLAVSSASDWSIRLTTLVYHRDYHIRYPERPWAAPIDIFYEQSCTLLGVVVEFR